MNVGETKIRVPAPQVQNGTYTIQNKQSGDHRTLRIRTIIPDDEQHPDAFVNKHAWKRTIELLTGPDNEHSFTMIGWLTDRGAVPIRKFESDIRRCSLMNLLYDLALGVTGGYHDMYEMMHEGRRMICNRKLTTPESVKSGIGPICAGRVA